MYKKIMLEIFYNISELDILKNNTYTYNDLPTILI